MNVVEVRNVSKKFRYDGKEFFAVNNVSFSVKSGEIFGFLGPNGAGKTTTLNMMIGILVPDIGDIKIFGRNVQKDRKLFESMSLTSGGSQFHGNLRVKDILNFYGRLYGLTPDEREKRIGRLVSFFGLEKIKNRKFWYLSTGEKMRLTFAKALLNYPKLLLLDEPTLGLDPDIAIKMRAEIRRINRKFGTTIIITSHYMHEVEQLCDRVAFIDRGQLVDIGSVEKVKSKQFSTYELFATVKNVRNRASLKRKGFSVSGRVIRATVDSQEKIAEMLYELARSGMEIIEIETKKPTLEDYFVKMMGARK